MEKQKEYLISEIVFDINENKELNKKISLIKKTINEKTFSEAAFIYSISDTSKNGGKLGWIKESMLSKIIKNDWLHYSSMHKIKIKVNNYTSIPSFQFNHGNKNEELYTLFTKFFLQKKILATNSLYLSFAHNHRNIAIYRTNLGSVFKSLSNHLIKNKKIKKKSLRKFTC